MNAVPDAQAGTTSGVNNAVSRVAALLAVAALGGVAVLGFDAYLAAADGDAALARHLREAGFGAPPRAPASLDAAALAELRAGATAAGVAAVTSACAAVAVAAGLVGLFALEDRPSPAAARRRRLA